MEEVTVWIFRTEGKYGLRISLQRWTLFHMMVKKIRIEILYWQLYIWLAAILYAWKVRDRVGSYIFSGEKFEDFSRIFQDPTLIYMNLPSTKQNVCVESYVLGINTCTYKNARQRELENTCKPDIHCASVGQFHMRESNEKAMGKNKCFHIFVRTSRILFSKRSKWRMIIEVNFPI